MLEVPGGSINVVPGRCRFSLDLRATTDAARDALRRRRAWPNSTRICARARRSRYALERTLRRRRRAQRAAPGRQRWEAAVAALGPAGAPHAQRRRPRRDEAARGDAAGDAVRARRQRRHQPQPAGDHHRRRRRARASPPSPHLLEQPGPRMTPDALHDALDAWIDAHFDEEVRFLQELVRVPTDTPPGDNAPHAERTAELLAAMGCAAEKHPVPAARGAGLRAAVDHQPDRAPPLRRRRARSIALNAHGDVVPPGEGWTHDPYGGEVVGRQALRPRRRR
ncbi:MAG: hypothetical protein MZW92_23180 [Comamonadaceae bacterium]|nr:hypothetical protein [Comamonadaceae bacterium]